MLYARVDSTYSKDNSKENEVTDQQFQTGDVEPVDALSEDECEAIGADGRDGRGWITESNLTPDERERLEAYRKQS